MRIRAITLAVLALAAVGSLAATGAIATGDEAADGVFLAPADTPNGDAYASLNGSGELVLDLAGLNDRATVRADAVFTVTSTHDEPVTVWVEPAADAVGLYRSDTGDPLTGAASAVALAENESVAVGMRVDTHGATPADSALTVHARLPSDDPPGGGGPGTGPSIPGTPPTDEPGDEPPTDDPPTDEPPTDEPPTDGPGEDPSTGDPGQPPSPDQSDPEVGGFPWLPLLALLGILVTVPPLFFAYRRARRDALRLAVAPDSGLELSPGAFDASHYSADDGTLSFAYETTAAWTDADGDGPVTFDGLASLQNATGDALVVTARVDDDAGGATGLRLLSDGSTDLLADAVTLAPGDSLDLAATLPAADGGPGSVSIRCEGHPAG